jgi:hypothetical protein
MDKLMKTTVSAIIAITFLSLTTIDASAQVLKRLQQKATDAVERKVEQKVDEKIEQLADRLVNNSFDAIFGEMEPNADGTPRKLPFTFGGNVAKEDVYTFNTVITMEIETIKANGSSDNKAEMIMHLNDNAMYTGTRITSDEMRKSNSDVFIIYDFKNESMLMLMDSEGSKMSMGYKWTEALAAIEEESGANDVNWDETEIWNGYKKIGTRTIAGYTCDGYEFEDDSASMQIWVSRDIGVNWHTLFGANANSKQLKGRIPDAYPAGMMMELTSTDKRSGEKMIMKVTDINERANVRYVMADYPTVSLGQ